ncbi:MAG: purine/pyrimidine permease [Peptococcaceae bacterium]|nr:purine/pyrimidine permease [Peptococcaceae bacterium]
MSQNGSQAGIIYDLEDRPPLGRTLAYSAQWLIFTLANLAVLPLVLGTALGLDQAGIAGLAQRLFFFSALASLLQVLFGHRLPIMEGPAGMWWGIFMTLAALAPGMGKPLPLLRTDLEAGLIAAGAVLVLVGASGLIGLALKLFTPAVTGSVLVLLGLQLSGTFAGGMLGVDSPHAAINLKSVAVSVLVLLVIFWVTLKGRGFLRSVAVLAGILAGWLVSVFVGLSGPGDWGRVEIIKFPGIFAWGMPTFDSGIVFTSVMTGLLVLSNLVASIMAMEKTIGREFPGRVYNRGVIFTGLADIMAGAGAAVGFVPYSAGAGMVSLSGVASRLPFIIFTLVMMLMGLVPPVGVFLSSIPAPVGYSALLASFAQMFGFGIRDYLRLKLDTRDFFVVGVSVLFGAGVMFLSPDAFRGLPAAARYILGNGFITGMILVILLEHVVLPARFGKKNID